MKKLSFYKFYKTRKDILNKNQKDFLCDLGSNKILISAPHGVSQVRLGKLKVAEMGTIPITYFVAKNTDSNMILKTQNLNDDANFDSKSTYRDKISSLIENGKCKFLFDIHGMAKSRDCDINLGINFGQNVKNNIALFNKLVENLEKAKFSVSIDQPFCAGCQTISGYFAKTNNIWTIQVEINCSITNEPKNIEKCNLLIETLINTIKTIDE